MSFVGVLQYCSNDIFNSSNELHFLIILLKMPLRSYVKIPLLWELFASKWIERIVVRYATIWGTQKTDKISIQCRIISRWCFWFSFCIIKLFTVGIVIQNYQIEFILIICYVTSNFLQWQARNWWQINGSLIFFNVLIHVGLVKQSISSFFHFRYSAIWDSCNFSRNYYYIFEGEDTIVYLKWYLNII